MRTDLIRATQTNASSARKLHCIAPPPPDDALGFGVAVTVTDLAVVPPVAVQVSALLEFQLSLIESPVTTVETLADSAANSCTPFSVTTFFGFGIRYEMTSSAMADGQAALIAAACENVKCIDGNPLRTLHDFRERQFRH